MLHKKNNASISNLAYLLLLRLDCQHSPWRLFSGDFSQPRWSIGHVFSSVGALSTKWNEQTQHFGGCFKFRFFSQFLLASSSLGSRWKLYHFGHEHSALFFGLWSKHSDFNQLFSFVWLLVHPRTAHVVPELFKAISLFSDRASDVNSLPADQVKTQLWRDA